MVLIQHLEHPFEVFSFLGGHLRGKVGGRDGLDLGELGEIGNGLEIDGDGGAADLHVHPRVFVDFLDGNPLLGWLQHLLDEVLEQQAYAIHFGD